MVSLRKTSFWKPRTPAGSSNWSRASLRNTILALPTQKLLVENIAAARWRQWRIWGMQKVAFDDEVASPSTTNDPPLRAVLAWQNSADSMRTHELLLRYEIALDRQISRSLVRLLQLQAVELHGSTNASAEPIAPPPPARKPPASETSRGKREWCEAHGECHSRTNRAPFRKINSCETNPATR